jgi:hypothetical protein
MNSVLCSALFVEDARDTLLTSCGGEPSEFVEDLRPRGAS